MMPPTRYRALRTLLVLGSKIAQACMHETWVPQWVLHAAPDSRSTWLQGSIHSCHSTQPANAPHQCLPDEGLRAR